MGDNGNEPKLHQATEIEVEKILGETRRPVLLWPVNEHGVLMVQGASQGSIGSNSDHLLQVWSLVLESTYCINPGTTFMSENVILNIFLPLNPNPTHK